MCISRNKCTTAVGDVVVRMTLHSCLLSYIEERENRVKFDGLCDPPHSGRYGLCWTSGEKMVTASSYISLSLGASVALGLALLTGWLYASLSPQFANSATNLISTNDLLLHRYIVNYIAKNFNSISVYDFFLPLNTGFPLLGHYQHLPHIIVGTLRYTWQHLILLYAIVCSAGTICRYSLPLAPRDDAHRYLLWRVTSGIFKSSRIFYGFSLANIKRSPSTTE